MRAYWERPYESEFEARVVRAWSEGEKHFAVLDQTLFYPTSGGQACDTGTLNGVAVLEVLEEAKATGPVIHRLQSPLPEGQLVVGRIEWARRYRQMQRHTAEHMLGQAFLRAAGWNVVAVNMLNPVCTMDFDGAPDEAVIRQAEALANWAVYANTAVRTYFIDEAEAPAHGLRRAPKVTGLIRVVEIEGWDKVACGGLHVARSGEAGPIKITRFERYKGGTRVYFVAGWEALELFDQEHRLLSRLGEWFSSSPLELEKPIGNLREEWRRARAENALLKDELAERIMRDLLTEFPTQTIAAQVPNSVLDMVGRRLAEWPGVLALLLAQAEDKARYVLLKHPSRSEDLQTIWEEVLKPLGARGGGALVKLGVMPLKALHPALLAFERYLAQER
ncbi:serine-tRNA(Ala) deacylase AlaX [Meiothermus taiwanensis]|uniref:Threonyl/alanyl tRNA synthetase SAD n=1 Tax=Meiothermus taiwanensis WR-220 TaxID=1339250 RepID=A0ABN5M0R8_9DEIN|nr:serine-tRNA(Ala) deacylase AlaX [Meiothermus taiwanensis]AWR87853.1 threonyl/alanyl tRNA synthetase SAD [Meiothermus taiwanensis WR-220]KIQ54491.1 alanyl-tRNA synthetase [Meiothermus taiwanensis]KZK15449.1 alanyl-tRNA editing protein [Meiothermus taiwanensis]